MAEKVRAEKLLGECWPALFAVTVLFIMGVLDLYSASSGTESSGWLPIYARQALFFLVGVGAGVVVLLLDYRRWVEHAWILYGICVILLVAVLIVGKVTSGSQRWIHLGPVAFQPSELTKWTMLLVVAKHFKSIPAIYGRRTLKDALKPALATALVSGLIVLQPDLGSAILILLISGSTIIFAGLSLGSLLKVALVTVAGLPLAWRALAEYQKRRIITFFDPQQDPLGAGYHVTQSKIAVGSGGLWGKGYMQGTQSQLHFLPEHHTDFAFSVWAEEWGFVGCVVLLGMFLLLLMFGLYVASRAEDPIARLLALGIVAFFFWPVVINVGMTLGLMPVVGIALPFISYGGSSLLVCMMAVGLLLNIHTRRFMF